MQVYSSPPLNPYDLRRILQQDLLALQRTRAVRRAISDMRVRAPRRIQLHSKLKGVLVRCNVFIFLQFIIIPLLVYVSLPIYMLRIKLKTK